MDVGPTEARSGGSWAAAARPGVLWSWWPWKSHAHAVSPSQSQPPQQQQQQDVGSHGQQTTPSCKLDLDITPADEVLEAGDSSNARLAHAASVCVRTAMLPNHVASGPEGTLAQHGSDSNQHGGHGLMDWLLGDPISVVRELMTIVNYTRAAYGYAMAAGVRALLHCD